MKRPGHLLISFILGLALAAGLLAGCGGSDGSGAGSGEAAPGGETTQSDTAAGEGSWTAPALLLSEYHGDLAASAGEAYIDVSAVSDGYVGVSAVSDSRLKFQVLKGEETYTYDLDGDGTPRIFPLQCGDGTYTLRVMENVTDNKYAELYSIDQDVVLTDEFQPFLRPTAYVNYTADSLCVQKANELAATANNEEDVVKAIFDYVTKNIKYDKEKAEAATTIYLPDPDETMESGKGICFDYASLTASMLRSQGIPTKVIFGYVSPDDLYHAWNMFYTEESGWVTVEFAVDPNDWNRLDLTTQTIHLISQRTSSRATMMIRRQAQSLSKRSIRI